MFGHAKAQDVLTEILKTSEKLAIHIKLMLSSGMDGPNVKKSVLNKLNKISKKGEKLSTASQVPTELSDSCLPQEFQERNCKLWL